MDARTPSVEPTPPPNLRRVRLKPTPATPETNAQTLSTSQTASPAASTPDTPRFARKRQMSAFEVFQRNTRGDPNDVPGASLPESRLDPDPLDAGRGASNAEPERPNESHLPLYFSRGTRRERKKKSEGRARDAPRTSFFSAETTTEWPLRSRAFAVGDAAKPVSTPHSECSECVEKDAAIARLTAQLSRLRARLGAVETLAERQAERETVSEHDLSRLERKLRAYREALRKHAGGTHSPSSSSDAGPSRGDPWGSRGDGDEGESLGQFPRGASEDELGLHKVHGGTRFRAPSPRGTGTGTERVGDDDADRGTMRE